MRKSCTCTDPASNEGTGNREETQKQEGKGDMEVLLVVLQGFETDKSHSLESSGVRCERRETCELW